MIDTLVSTAIDNLQITPPSGLKRHSRTGPVELGEGGQGERPRPQTSIIRAKITQYSGNVWIFTTGNIQF